MPTDAARIGARLESLALFRELLEDELVFALTNHLVSPSRLSYAELAGAVYESGMPLGEYLLAAALGSENAYVRARAEGREPSAGVLDALELELETLQLAADLGSEDLLAGRGMLPGDREMLPAIDTCKLDLAGEYRARTDELERWGYGIYAGHRAFVLDETGEIVPVLHPDTTSLSDLYGYEREKDIIVRNTRALIARRPAANILLTGDAGTGKSSTVKAVVNELADEGLRIIELRKSQLHLLPGLLDELNRNPLAFILFIDDLSFSSNDDDYAALKAILEGSVAAKSRNVAVYATSNRRHLVRERMSDREGDEVHLRDTLQEVASLSERFGIRVSFSRPDKDTYLEIVRALAEAAGLSPDEETDAAAERFALRGGGRSARRARQFVDSLLAE